MDHYQEVMVASSFRFCHAKSREVPPGGGLTITPYPVRNTTPLALKSCMEAITMDH